MKLSGTYEINAPREKVFSAITDPTVLQRCNVLHPSCSGTFAARFATK